MNKCKICRKPSGKNVTCSPECLSELKSRNSRKNKNKTNFNQMDRKKYNHNPWK